jgi:predicted XRE-type DNA-binding protein
MTKRQDTFESSTGNVFEDMGLPNPEEELARAQLASRIHLVIKQRRLTQVVAAKVMGIDQPKVSALLNGRLSGFTLDRLMRLLTALGQDVNITIKSSRARTHGHVRVMAGLWTMTLADALAEAAKPRLPIPARVFKKARAIKATRRAI